jgi:Methyltransferase domain
MTCGRSFAREPDRRNTRSCIGPVVRLDRRARLALVRKTCVQGTGGRADPAGRVAGVCHGVCVDEDLWDAYDQMGLSFWQHAADSAYNAHYDRPAMLAALGPVTGRRVLDAACGPGLYLRELLEQGAEVTAFEASPVMVGLARKQTAGRVRIDQAALGGAAALPRRRL